MEHGVIIIVLSYRLTDLSCRKKFCSDEVNSVKSLFGSVSSPSFVANLYGVTADAGGGGGGGGWWQKIEAVKFQPILAPRCNEYVYNIITISINTSKSYEVLIIILQ